jgi:transcriptional regulator with XRE-family HTH domain
MPRQTATDAQHGFAMALAATMKARRIELQLSRESLSRNAGVSAANVRRLESGISTATSFVTIGRLARILGLSLDDLFTAFPTEAHK